MHTMKNKFKEGKSLIIECKPFLKENLAGNRIMIQIQTELTVADNTGQKELSVLKFLVVQKEDMPQLEI